MESLIKLLRLLVGALTSRETYPFTKRGNVLNRHRTLERDPDEVTGLGPLKSAKTG